MSDWKQSTTRFVTLFTTFLLASQLFAADIPAAGSAPILSMKADEIVSRMVSSNQQRAAALRAYEGHRSYSLKYQGFPSSRQAAIEVVAHYSAPDSKKFDVVSESGSHVLQTKVLLKLLESEREAAGGEGRRNSALTGANYNFTLLGTRPSAYGGCYRLAVEPKRDEKFLYRGEICVNATDFAVESINAEPARNPSFWIKKTRIEHSYQKIGQFWLPASNQTVTNVRLGGTATLNITYSSYALQPPN